MVDGSKLRDRVLGTLKDLDPEFSKFVEDNCFLAGGAVRDYVKSNGSFDQIKDYDIFFKTKEALDQFLRNKIIDRMQHHPTSGCYNLITIETGYTIDIQFVTMKYGSPQQVVNTFDFMQNKGYIDSPW